MPRPLLPRTAALIACLAVALAGPVPARAADVDCDAVEDSVDNCPDRFNPDQGDLDLDGAGDACDADKDGDGVDNGSDNCVRHDNAGQDDVDADAAGDACDRCEDTPDAEVADRRGCSIDQLCPCSGPDPDRAWKHHDQYLRCIKRKTRNFRRHRLLSGSQVRDFREEARESACGWLIPSEGDNDGDFVLDEEDNCVSTSNPSQRDTDGDLLGDACDTDKDNDGVLNRDDNCPVDINPDTQNDDADGDTVGDSCDACAATSLATPVDREGCSIDQNCRCDQDDDGNPWRSHGRYVRCVKDEAYDLRQSGRISKEEAEAFRDSARASSCGERELTCE